MTEHDDGLPLEYVVRAECELKTTFSDVVGVYECSDEAIGCSVEEFYSEFEEGYYIVDTEYRETLNHTTDKDIAYAYAMGYAKGDGRPEHVPLFARKHEEASLDSQTVK